jgi:hypothetical protein
VCLVVVGTGLAYSVKRIVPASPLHWRSQTSISRPRYRNHRWRLRNFPGIASNLVDYEDSLMISGPCQS